MNIAPLLFAVLPAALAGHALKTGKIRLRHATVRREAQQVEFWAIVAIYSGIALYLAWLAFAEP